MWRKNILEMNRNEAKKNLEEKLFILDPELGQVLREHKNICTDMEDLRFVQMGTMTNVQNFDEFAQTQQKQRSDVRDKISSYSLKSRDRFRLGIQNILDELKEKINSEQDDGQDLNNWDNKDEVNPQLAGGKTDSITSEQG